MFTTESSTSPFLITIVKLLSVFAGAVFIGTTVAVPSPSPSPRIPKSVKEVYAKAYGCIGPWTSIRLIDIFPNATVDGKPADESVIYSYKPPVYITPEVLEKKIASRSPHTKRQEWGPDTERCGRDGNHNQIPHNQIRSASSTFCADAIAAIPIGGEHWQNKNLWFDGDANTWKHFTNQKGTDYTVFFRFLRMLNMRTVWETCRDQFDRLSNDWVLGMEREALVGS